MSINRRTFLRLSAASGVALAGPASLTQKSGPSAANEIWVSSSGSDTAAGSRTHPLANLPAARDHARRLRMASPDRSIHILLRAGTYSLAAPLVLTSEDSGTAEAPTVWASAPGETAVLSGGVPISPAWTHHTDAILKTAVPPGSDFDQLFLQVGVADERQILARYPNFDPNVAVFNGYAADAIAPERVARWADPIGAYLQAMHRNNWGGLSWQITGKKPDGSLAMEGGWQTNRPAGPHPQFRYVEGVFEELDAPNEWFLDRKTNTLYYYPPAGLDLAHARFTGAGLPHLIELRGTAQSPVRFVQFRGLTLRHTARTFMLTREPLVRSDWAIYRGGAVLMRGTEDCALENLFLDQPGGNGIFVDGYNRRTTIRRTRVDRAGASSICFVGSPSAVRDGVTENAVDVPLATMDMTPGPKSPDYPQDCLVDDCLLSHNGRFEKQSAGVEIDIASRITVRHASIYGSPRSGINIGDGCFGGHEVDGCDIFDTVLETGDHGSFNSWGRDRYWSVNRKELDDRVAAHPELPFLDAIEPVKLHDSRWRCDKGWDIDLDDGSTNYLIYNNLCLHGGIKLREGFRRICRNNVLLGHGFDFHVWPLNEGNVIESNIVPQASYGTAFMYPPPWGASIDNNLVHIPGSKPVPSAALQKQSGRDVHSIEADAQFVDAAHGDYRVAPTSPALKLGFVNFPMGRFGVQYPALRKLAATPLLPIPSLPNTSDTPDVVATWRGLRVRNMRDEREMSAYGLSQVRGAIVTSVPPGSPFAAAGLQVNDIILSVDGKPVATAAELASFPAPSMGATTVLGLYRSQRNFKLNIP